MSYTDRLQTIKLPFKEWSEYGADCGLDQYTIENCDRAESILINLRSELIKQGELAADKTKVAAFESAVIALNSLNTLIGGHFIETGEREELCELFDQFAVCAGLEPSKFGEGEGIASEWREW